MGPHGERWGCGIFCTWGAPAGAGDWEPLVRRPHGSPERSPRCAQAGALCRGEWALAQRPGEETWGGTVLGARGLPTQVETGTRYTPPLFRMGVGLEVGRRASGGCDALTLSTPSLALAGRRRMSPLLTLKLQLRDGGNGDCRLDPKLVSAVCQQPSSYLSPQHIPQVGVSCR